MVPAVEKTNEHFFMYVDTVIGSAVLFSRGTWLSCPSQAFGTESLSKILTRETGSVIIAYYFRWSSRPVSHFYMSAIVAFVSGSSTSRRHPAFS